MLPPNHVKAPEERGPDVGATVEREVMLPSGSQRVLHLDLVQSGSWWTLSSVTKSFLQLKCHIELKNIKQTEAELPCRIGRGNAPSSTLSSQGP